ncbi:MAG: CcmD family protein [Polyangiaceae bacterium]|nr:CcmD family protein [Polyangiaceae bacterium]
MILFALHQNQPKEPQDRSTEFAAVDGTHEQYNGATLLVTAYALLWILLMGFLLMLWRKQRALGRRLDGLEAAIDRAASKTHIS